MIAERPLLTSPVLLNAQAYIWYTIQTTLLCHESVMFLDSTVTFRMFSGRQSE